MFYRTSSMIVLRIIDKNEEKVNDVNEKALCSLITK